MLPTLEDFLIQKFPSNSYINHPDFSELYIRKGPVGLRIGNVFYRCNNALTIARVVSRNPGDGNFSKLVDDLIKREFAIYVESVCNVRFARKLEKLGFNRVGGLGLNYLKNKESDLVPWYA